MFTTPRPVAGTPPRRPAVPIRDPTRALRTSRDWTSRDWTSRDWTSRAWTSRAQERRRTGRPVAERAARPPYVAVVGPGRAPSGAVEALAEAVGRRLAEAGAVLVCGGLGGVMAAACRGAVSAGGTTVGLLPGDDRRQANPWVTVAVPTGLGELRNGLVVRAADAVVAVAGEHGTLTEVALALDLRRPVVGLGTWQLVRPDGSLDAGIVVVDDPVRAADEALRLAGARGG